ncbi:hypothetical protein GTZ97_10845 [Aquabacterium fontiphilum]|uniref:hypothetical protein n=1 Tax=Aquabacterium fontiphilum TaxID=450365 RepID=UPI00137699AA|nr:hypothetical protein [Aquabacterium fontiphilum]NBD21161.1 hypothetical protein [Aquabacterium fontiphilum]
MRRLVAIVLLLWMPLHALWAAAAPYCTHDSRETAAGAERHLGHHAHPHPAHAEVGGGGDPTGGGHPECHACHACSSVVPACLRAPTAAPVEAQRACATLHTPPGPWPARPERPKWPLLA